VEETVKFAGFLSKFSQFFLAETDQNSLAQFEL
jgi:hypothetical protein